VLHVTISGATRPGIDFGQLAVDGSAALGGALAIDTAPGYVPPIGTTINILSTQQPTGSFAKVTGAEVPSGHWSVVYGPTGIALKVVSGSSLPTARFTPSTYTPAVGQSVAFNGSASSDPEGSITGYRWVWGDGTPDGAGPTATHVFATQGRFSAALYVTDSQGQTGAVGHGITVGDELPSALYAPSTYTPAQGQAVSFNGGASSDPDGSISAYRWVWGDGSPDGSGVTATHVFAAQGRFSAALYVTDSQGQTGAVGHGITVGDELPSALYAPSTYTPAQGQAVSFNGGGSSDPDGSVSAYRWVWGDGTPDGSGATASHVFATQGKFSAALYVTDVNGQTAAVGHGITVGPPSAGPLG
jgi:PKD repeat protein